MNTTLEEVTEEYFIVKLSEFQLEEVKFNWYVALYNEGEDQPSFEIIPIEPEATPSAIIPESTTSAEVQE